jgi:hypothetical protein
LGWWCVGSGDGSVSRGLNTLVADSVGVGAAANVRRLVKLLLLDSVLVSANLLLVTLGLLGLGYTDEVVKEQSGGDIEDDVDPENTVELS